VTYYGDIKVGHRYILKDGRCGVCLYVGDLYCMKEHNNNYGNVYIGLCLEGKKDIGDCDGEIHGKRYFTCPSDKGVLVERQHILKECGKYVLLCPTGKKILYFLSSLTQCYIHPCISVDLFENNTKQQHRVSQKVFRTLTRPTSFGQSLFDFFNDESSLSELSQADELLPFEFRFCCHVVVIFVLIVFFYCTLFLFLFLQNIYVYIYLQTYIYHFIGHWQIEFFGFVSNII
ncbi:hypothetical protein RFI_01929, partial [Reticulomyxa filosa]